MIHARAFLVAAGLTLAALPAFAQDKAPAGPPVRLRATIEKFDNNMLTVKTEKGADATLTMTPKTNISGVAKRSLADIKPDDFIGVTAMNAKDGSMHATEVHMFPAAMRGAGEGHYPWDKGPESTMTNAAVTGMVDSTDGKNVKLGYKNKDGTTGSVDIDIGPNIPIVTFVPGDASLLQPGAAIVAFALRNPDGGMTALGIVAEKDGVKPPM